MDLISAWHASQRQHYPSQCLIYWVSSKAAIITNHHHHHRHHHHHHRRRRRRACGTRTNNIYSNIDLDSLATTIKSTTTTTTTTPTTSIIQLTTSERLHLQFIFQVQEKKIEGRKKERKKERKMNKKKTKRRADDLEGTLPPSPCGNPLRMECLCDFTAYRMDCQEEEDDKTD